MRLNSSTGMRNNQEVRFMGRANEKLKRRLIGAYGNTSTVPTTVGLGKWFA
jgi:hypothetical protein